MLTAFNKTNIPFQAIFPISNRFINSDKGLEECGTYVQFQANLLNKQNKSTSSNNNTNEELKSLTKENQELLKKNQEMIRRARQVQHWQGMSRMMQGFRNMGIF